MNEQECSVIYKWISDYSGGEPIKILNVGSGDSTYYGKSQPHILAKLINPLLEVGHEVINLDVKDGPGIHLVSPIGQIPVADNTYDVIIFASVIEHLYASDIPLALWQLKRVLKKDGLLIGSAPANYPKHDSYDSMLRIKSKEQWAEFFSPGDWRLIDYLETDKIPAKPFYKDFKEDTWMSMIKLLNHPVDVTVVCLTWNREQNIPRILEGISGLSVPAKIIFWDNGNNIDWSAYDVDHVIKSDKNHGSWVKNLPALLPDTEWTLFQDDDLMLHPKTVEVMLSCCKKHPGSLICLKYGLIDTDLNYIGSNYGVKEMPVDFPVGRVMLVRTELIGAVFDPRLKSAVDYHEEDLALGLAIQMLTNEPSYCVSVYDCKPVDLPENRHGNWSRPWHKANRSMTIKKFLDLGWRSKI